MRKRWIRLAALAATVAAGLAQAQLPLPVMHGEPAVAPKAAQPARLRLAGPGERVVLPPVPEREVERVREANRRAASRPVQRVMIGVERAAARQALPSAPELRWSAVEGGRAARVSITSPAAGSMRVALALAGVPDDVEMVFFGSEAPGRLEGPLRVGEVRDRTVPWWSPLTEGDTLTVEIFVPAPHDPAAMPLALAGVSHVFTAPSSRFAKRLQEIGSAGSCNVDVACSPLNGSEAFRNVAASVAQMVFNDGGLTGLCTGSLLNDSDPGSQVPWLYSANHCFDNPSAPFKTPAQLQAVADTLTTIWRFDASACGSATPTSAWSQLGGGAALLHNDVPRDVLFLRLNRQPPAGTFYSGWDANPLAAGAPVISIHHPRGDLKKVSEGRVVAISTPGVAVGDATYFEVRWSSGTTEPGSSGSGLWSTGGGQYLFRGGLWGGDALCSNTAGTDHFSRLDQSYPSLAKYLATAGGGEADYTDLWWNASESGWGLNLIHHPATRVIFGVWYTYEPDGTRTWLVMPSGTWTSGNTYSGPLYRTAGPPYDRAGFDAGLVRRVQVGSLTIAFSDANNAQLSYTVDGVSGSKRITRQPF